MTSEQRVDRLCEIWFTAASRNCKLEMIAAFDNHAAEQREICANTLRDDLAGVFVQVNPVLINTLTKNCLNAIGGNDEIE